MKSAGSSSVKYFSNTNAQMTENDTTEALILKPSCNYCKISGPGCSKLTTSLVAKASLIFSKKKYQCFW